MRFAIARKQPWTLAEWHSFADRCRSLRDRIREFARTFPDTRGFHASHLDALLKIHRQLVAAMIGVENVVERQHPDTYGSVMTALHVETRMTGTTGRTGNSRSSRVLTRRQWADLGAELKAIHAELSEILGSFQATAYATKPHVNRFARVASAIGAAKCKLDSLVYLQHPGWEEFTRVFYGPTVPAGIDAEPSLSTSSEG